MGWNTFTTVEEEEEGLLIIIIVRWSELWSETRRDSPPSSWERDVTVASKSARRGNNEISSCEAGGVGQNV
jgi:hypothetical protein